VVNGMRKASRKAEDILLVIAGAPNPNYLLVIPTVVPSKVQTRPIATRD